MILLAAMTVFSGTPQRTVSLFLRAFNAHHSASMARLTVGRQRAEFPFDGLTGFPSLTPSFGALRVRGSEATLEVRLAETFPRGDKGDGFRETVRLRKVGTEWRIVPGEALTPDFGDRSRAKPIGTLAMLVTQPGVSAALREHGLESRSLRRAKALAVGCLMYAMDHQRRFPPLKGFKAAILPYVFSADHLTAPGDPKGSVGYFPNPRLAGKTLPQSTVDDLRSVAHVAFVLQGKDGKVAFPYKGRTAVGFGDGHAALLTPGKIAKLR